MQTFDTTYIHRTLCSDVSAYTNNKHTIYVKLYYRMDTKLMQRFFKRPTNDITAQRLLNRVYQMGVLDVVL